MALLTGGANFIRYLLFAFNLCFVITGIIIISVAATVQGVYWEYDSFLIGKFFSIPTFLIVIGVFIFIIAFFGCCGAYKENYCMILIFSILLSLIFIFELSAGIAGYVLRSEAHKLIDTELQNTMVKYSNSSYPKIQYIWDSVQTSFECCGSESYKDWGRVFENNKEKLDLPMSCCDIPNGVIGNYSCNGAKINNKHLHGAGCLNKFADFIESHAVSLGATGIIFAIIQLIGIFFACYIARQVKIKTGASGLF
ncbi:CD63 antigen [Condylostylus longicornis]|uniref:CD63 antigen n=1 Tax=Condylostylus longicornis TaxID=2530218 RepID=UPI00244E0F5F|nr:CD63 antigen [Condylostylus longicornis]XP_055377310.1 CD63 antigen [Condylostylus longicornis]XP_055377311.1 CD63 antigen [Condylostylus longicornis]